MRERLEKENRRLQSQLRVQRLTASQKEEEEAYQRFIDEEDDGPDAGRDSRK